MKNQSELVDAKDKLKYSLNSLIDMNNNLMNNLSNNELQTTDKLLEYCTYYNDTKIYLSQLAKDNSFIAEVLNDLPDINYKKYKINGVLYINPVIVYILLAFSMLIFAPFYVIIKLKHTKKMEKLQHKLKQVSAICFSITSQIDLGDLNTTYNAPYPNKTIIQDDYSKEIGYDDIPLEDGRLVIKNIEKSYKKVKVVKGVSFYMTKGEVIGLLGPNGAGKTTTFYMVVGLVLPDAGQIFFNEREITKLPMYQRSKLGIGYLAQEASIFKKLSVQDNILAILELSNLTKQKKQDRLEELLEELDIKYIRKSKGFQLSGGERRRTEIARALASNPEFLLLDEPFAGVDPIAVQEIQKIINKLKKKNIGILITDHNARETLKITDRSYIMAEGIIRYSGTAIELAHNEEVRKIYLGDEFSL